MAAGWTPILVGSARDKAVDAIADIARALADVLTPERRRALARETGLDPTRRHRQDREDPSLSRGSSGIAIFFGYLELAGLDPSHGSSGRDIAQETQRIAASTLAHPGLFSGFTGMSWSLRHLHVNVPQTYVPCDTDEIDTVLLDLLREPRMRFGFDLISGLTGIGLYALDHPDEKVRRELLTLVVHRLKASSVDDAVGTTWIRPSESISPKWKAARPEGYFDDGCVDLGVAHGLPGIVGLLALIAKADVEVEIASELVGRGTRWLLAHRLPAPSTAAFGDYFIPGRPTPPAQHAWCYGDPGVAAILIQSGRVLNEPQWVKQGLEISRHAAARTPHDLPMVDTGLCHGMAGLAHVFNRMYQYTGDPVFSLASRYWYARTLGAIRPGRGVAGWLGTNTRVRGRDAWKYPEGFLYGAAGVGLALLGAVSEVEPRWDRVLLLS